MERALIKNASPKLNIGQGRKSLNDDEKMVLVRVWVKKKFAKVVQAACDRVQLKYR
jgi:hypothetical protein